MVCKWFVNVEETLFQSTESSEYIRTLSPYARFETFECVLWCNLPRSANIVVDAKTEIKIKGKNNQQQQP